MYDKLHIIITNKFYKSEVFMSDKSKVSGRYGYIVIIIMTIALLSTIPLSRKFQSQPSNIAIATSTVESSKIYKFSNPKSTTELPVSVYNTTWQQTVQAQLDQLKRKNYKMNAPLLVENPYGTNTLSVYTYFTTKEPVQIECTISADGVNDYTYTLKNESENNLTTRHEYQLIGIVPDKPNTVTLKAIDASGSTIETATIAIDGIKMKSEFTPVVNSTIHEESIPLSDGLYFILGKDYEVSTYNFMVDNDGVVRGEIPVDSYHTDNVHFVNGNMIYNYSSKYIAVVNRLGHVVNTYSTGEYAMHHDFIFDKNGDMLILASKNGQGSVEDFIIKIDSVTKEITELVNFKTLLPDYYVSTTLRLEKDKHDWIHFNSIDMIDEKLDTIVLSGREVSTIITVSDIYNEPKIDYMIADESLWEGYSYEELLLEKQGDFVSQAGQHTVVYQKDEGMANSTYYLYMFNNNFGNLPTRPDFKWDKLPGVGTFGEGEKSMYYKYLVDENKKTYTLVDEISFDYSAIVSSTQYVGDNLVINSGRAGMLYEYTKDGKLIKSFNYQTDSFAYRIFKYDLKGYLFA